MSRQSESWVHCEQVHCCCLNRLKPLKRLGSVDILRPGMSHNCPLVPCSPHPDTTRRIPDIPSGRNYSTLGTLTSPLVAYGGQMIKTKWDSKTHAERKKSSGQCERNPNEDVCLIIGDTWKNTHIALEADTQKRQVNLNSGPIKTYLCMCVRITPSRCKLAKRMQ